MKNSFANFFKENPFGIACFSIVCSLIASYIFIYLPTPSSNTMASSSPIANMIVYVDTQIDGENKRIDNAKVSITRLNGSPAPLYEGDHQGKFDQDSESYIFKSLTASPGEKVKVSVQAPGYKSDSKVYAIGQIAKFSLKKVFE